MTTRFNDFTRLVRGSVHVAIGCAAVTMLENSAAENSLEKLTDLLPVTVAHGENITVGISSNGFILVATCGDDWRPATAPAVRFRAVAYGCGKFIAVGNSGAIAISSDGIDWTQIPSATVASLYSIAYGNNRFVAVGNEGAILRSTDGVRWKTADVTESRLRGITFGNGRFIAVGHEGTLMSSNDGAHWRFHDTGVGDRLESVAFGNGRFVAVGWNGSIITSDGDRWMVARLPGQPRLVRVVFRASAFQTFFEHGLSVSSVDGVTWQTSEVTSRGAQTLAFSGGR